MLKRLPSLLEAYTGSGGEPGQPKSLNIELTYESLCDCACYRESGGTIDCFDQGPAVWGISIPQHNVRARQ